MKKPSQCIEFVADNAQAESFFARLKTELVEGGMFETVEQARSEIFSYIKGYYNRICRGLIKVE